MGNRCTITPFGFVDSGLSRLLHDFVAPIATPVSPPRSGPVAAAPPLSAWESESGYGFEFEVPGLAEGDVELEILDGVLTVRGCWPATLPEGVKVLRSERSTGEFSRAIRLPGLVDDTGVTAELKNGVLRIELPKRAEARPRKIEISRAVADRS